MAVEHIARTTGPGDWWRRALWHANRRRTVVLTRESDGRDGRDLLDAELERAAVASVLDDEGPTRDAALVGAASAAEAAAIAAVRERGSVELRGFDPPRVFAAQRSVLPPGEWLPAWGAARVTRDSDALSALETPALLELLGEIGDDFWTPVGSALAALGPDAAAAEDRLAAARAVVSAPEPAIVEPGYVSHLVLPLLDLAAAIIRRDQQGFDAACAAAIHQHKRWYGTEERSFDKMGLLAFGALGLAALAHDVGLSVRVDSGYLPLDLVRGSVIHPGGTVRYRYPPGRLHRSDEANWFLDLERFPRAGRTHVVVERHGRLWASYTARGAPGLAWAALSVEPPPLGPPPPPGPEDLLDIGELILAADLLSTRAGDELRSVRERRDWLAEASDCLAEVRDRVVRSGAEPGTLVFTDRGRAAYRAEPGRFDPERLRAVEAVWRARVGDWDAELAARAARASAMESMTLLRLHLDPILRLIGDDRTGAAARQLQPRPDDYAKVFMADVVDAARARYEAFWSGPVELRHPSGPRTWVMSHLAPAGMLADDNELSWKFPGGYRSIAPLLVPERVWVAWKYVVPGETSGLAYDGLVWCDDHWSWLPRPYRVLRGMGRPARE
jgi:hypothetical protein